MNYMDILTPVLIFGAIGLVMAAVLAVASKVFAIKSDPKEEQISELLPGANCGGCGYAGCSACAAAIAKGEAPVDACSAISSENLAKICEIMGVEASAKVPMKATVMCSGQMDKAIYKYYFDGSKTCAEVKSLLGGDKECAYACLGYGDCMKACVFGAISMDNGIAKIDKNLCTGCGTCARTCPKSVISLIPKDSRVYVKCQSQDKGAAMKLTCSAGCIGCKLCEKTCESGAIKVENNFAKIDPEKCTGCGACAEKCPKKVIVIEGE